MSNPNFNSLANRLKENGILFSEDLNNSEDKIAFNENFFNSKESEEEIFDIEENKTKTNPIAKKRINQIDLDLIKGSNQTETQPIENRIKTLKRFLNLNDIRINSGSTNIIELLLYKFFPKIYKAKLVKKALSKFVELDIDTKTLLQKNIPYGENDLRYANLVKYIQFANKVQVKLKKDNLA